MRQKVLRRLAAVAVLAGLAAPAALADKSWLTADEFDRLSRGKTIAYIIGGRIVGQEAHLSGRRSVWQALDGTCQTGRWETRAEDICFRYKGDAQDHCMRFFMQNGKLFALSLNADGTWTQSEGRFVPNDPLACQ